MFDRDWDPGAQRKFTIRGESYGDGISGDLSGDLRINHLRSRLKEFQPKRVGNGDTIGLFRIWLSFRSLEWMRNPEDQAQALRGMNFVIIKMKSLLSIIETGNINKRYANDKKDIWILDRIFFGILEVWKKFSDDWVEIHRINYGGFFIYGLGFWHDNLSYDYRYIRSGELLFISITASLLRVYDLNCFAFLLLVLVIISQAQLVGKSGDGKNGEGNHKRLKILIPHFDNSDLIKSYSKTLIGRCFNPVKQEVSSLMVMLPKIWKVEERVVGADLGMGRFQFHFDTEEDIVAVLEMNGVNLMSLIGGWNEWNKFDDFGVWIWFKLLQRKNLNFLLM